MTTPLYRIRDKENNRYDDTIIVLNNGKMISDKFYLPIVGEERFIIERCSGIKDKNGVLMYEGDIVTFGLDYKEIKYTLIYEGMQWKISDGYYLKFATDGKDLEAIGNIHQ